MGWAAVERHLGGWGSLLRQLPCRPSYGGVLVGPRLVIEQFRFRRQGQWFCWEFGLLTFLVGPTRSGKSTALEALLHSLFLSSATVMPQVRKCDQLQVVFRVGGVRWQATRSGRTSRGLVTFTNLSDASAAERVFPVTARKTGGMNAGGFVQELLGIPAASRGKAAVGLDQVLSSTVVLRQRAIASAFLDGSDAERTLTLKTVLGLWDEDLEQLEKASTEAKSRHDAARRTLAQFKKLRDDGLLADPASIRAEHEQKVRDHLAAAGRWQEAESRLGGFAGELGRLDALYKVADKSRKKALRKADEASSALGKAIDAHARAEGELAGLLQPAPDCCSRCRRVLPDVRRGCVPSAGRPATGSLRTCVRHGSQRHGPRSSMHSCCEPRPRGLPVVRVRPLLLLTGRPGTRWLLVTRSIGMWSILSGARPGIWRRRRSG